MGKALRNRLNEETTNSRKVVVFRLGRHFYLIEIDWIEEISRLKPFATIPNSPEQVEGVIKFQNKAVVVINLAKLLGLKKGEITIETCIIIVRNKNCLIGLLVDAVQEAIDIADSYFQSPDSGSQFYSSYAKAVAYLDSRFLILLDVEKIILEQSKLCLSKPINNELDTAI